MHIWDKDYHRRGQGNNVESTLAVAKWKTGPGCAITVTSSAAAKTNDDDRDATH